MVRVRAWLDPGVPAATWLGVVSTVLGITAVTLLVYPLKQVFEAGALDGLYIPVILFLLAKWNLLMGAFAAALGALEFSFFHLEPLYRFSGLPAEAIAFAAVVAGGVYVYWASVRARTAEERRRQEAIARGRIVVAGDVERRRLVRDIHDGAQQRLATTAMVLRAALENVRKTDSDETRELVEEALEQTVQANAELRALAQGILPPLLTRQWLRSAIEALVSRMTLQVTVEIPAQRFPPAIESTAYFVISEAMTNVIKHSRAERAAVLVAVGSGQLYIDITDDGIGGAHANGTTGLVGLDDRVSALGGRLIVHSPAGRGTRIGAILPLDQG